MIVLLPSLDGSVLLDFVAFSAKTGLCRFSTLCKAVGVSAHDGFSLAATRSAF